MQRRASSNPFVALVAIAALALVSTSCIPARAGARCRSTDWGDGGANVLRCINGRWKAVMTRQQAIDAVIALANAAKRPAVGDVVSPASLGAPNIPNAADPAVLVDGATSYVFATSTYQHVPVATMANVDATLPMYRTTEAMPSTPAWARTPEIWAPTVHKLNGRYVMFFAAHRSGATSANSDQCVGRAVASSPAGPYVPDAAPTNCGNDGNGALDPSLFVGPDGSATLLVAMGGSNVNLWSIPLDADAVPTGPAVALLKREQPWQDWFLENPAMFYDGSTYLLAYSAGHWETDAYMTGIARCASPAGPCTDRPAGPWLASVGDRVGPGGLEFFVGSDGAARVAFHSYAAGDVGTVGKRSTTVRRFFTDPWPRLG